MSTLAWLFVAFMAVWLGIGVYLLSIGFRQKRIEERMDQLSRRATPPTDIP